MTLAAKCPRCGVISGCICVMSGRICDTDSVPPPRPEGVSLIDDLRSGVIEHKKRWSGDTHSDLGGSVDREATEMLMAQAADEIERLRLMRDSVEMVMAENRQWSVDAGSTKTPRGRTLIAINRRLVDALKGKQAKKPAP